MIAFRDPLPPPVRVESLKKVVDAPPTFSSPLVPWVVAIAFIALGAIVTSQQRQTASRQEMLAAALGNSLPREVQRGILAVVSPGSSMRDVRDALAAVRVTCRSERPSSGVLYCLGTPIVRENTFWRVRVSFVFDERAATLKAVHACPTFVHWSRTVVPVDLADRVAREAAGCWRDDANVSDNEWTYAVLPDHAFTTATVHVADTARRQGGATTDTLIVTW